MNKPEYTQDNIDRLTEEVTQHFYNDRHDLYMSNKEKFEDDQKTFKLDETDLEREIEEIEDEAEAVGGMTIELDGTPFNWTFDITDNDCEFENE